MNSEPMSEFAEKLAEWWNEVSIGDIELTIPKVNEYGSHDLIAQGKAIRPELPDAEAAIYGCMFYALGKVYRALNQLNRGEMPSEDTLFDLSIYSMMARFYHADAENQAKQKWSWFYDDSPILVRQDDKVDVSAKGVYLKLHNREEDIPRPEAYEGGYPKTSRYVTETDEAVWPEETDE